MPDRDPDVRIAIQHSIRLLGVWTAVLYGVVCLFLVAALLYAMNQRAALTRIQDETVSALCTFRNDLQVRYENGVQFIKDHPDGIPGIPIGTLKQSVENQRSTLISLQGLPCEEV